MNPAQILEQADCCVKCGLCLPHCPTYTLTADESESPRGRVALIQGLASGELNDSPRAYRHLDHCLQCRACETACPSQVPFSRLIDAIKQRRTDQRGSVAHRLNKIPLDVAADPANLFPALRLYAHSGLRRLLSRSGLLKFVNLDQADKILPTNLNPTHPCGTFRPQGTERGHVALFSGCVGRYLDARVHKAAIDVLIFLGYRVTVPQQSCCCGALHRHNGYAEEADRQSERSARIFGKQGFDAVLSTASACTGELKESPQLGPRILDINRFLADLDWPEPLKPWTSPQRPLVHVPCTQRNLLRDPQAAFDALQKIPGLDLSTFPDEATCCGAAGTYILKEPEFSKALVQNKIAHLRSRDATLLVTTNTGCALQLAAGIRAAGLAVEVCHPIEVLARHLPDV